MSKCLLLPQGKAVCCSGYRGGFSPDRKRGPSAEQLRDDTRRLFHRACLADLFPPALAGSLRGRLELRAAHLTTESHP